MPMPTNIRFDGHITTGNSLLTYTPPGVKGYGSVLVATADGKRLGIPGQGLKGYSRAMAAAAVLQAVYDNPAFDAQTHHWFPEASQVNFSGGLVLTQDQVANIPDLRQQNIICDLYGSPLGQMTARMHFNDAIADQADLKPVKRTFPRKPTYLTETNHIMTAEDRQMLEDEAASNKRNEINAELKKLRDQLKKLSEGDDAYEEQKAKIKDKEEELAQYDPNMGFLGEFWAIPAYTKMTHVIDINDGRDEDIAFFLWVLQCMYLNRNRYGGRKTTGGEIHFEYTIKRGFKGKYETLGKVTADNEGVNFENGILDFDKMVEEWDAFMSSPALFDTFDFTQMGQIERGRRAEKKEEEKKRADKKAAGKAAKEAAKAKDAA